MKPQRKPVNLFAKRLKMRPHSQALQANTTEGCMEVGNVSKEEIASKQVKKETGQTNGSRGPTKETYERKITDEVKKEMPNTLPDGGETGVGRTELSSPSAEGSVSKMIGQNVSLKPDGVAEGGAVPAASSAQAGIRFWLRDGTSIPLERLVEKDHLLRKILVALGQLAEKLESNPRLRPPAEVLPSMTKRCIERALKSA